RSSSTKTRVRIRAPSFLEVDPRDLTRSFIANLEELRLGKTKAVGDEISWKGFNHGVQIAHRAIVIAPGQLNLVLDARELVLQVTKIGVGLKLRIRLGDREQPSESRTHRLPNGRLLVDRT